MKAVKKYSACVTLLLIAAVVKAHVINYELDRMDDGEVVWKYLQEGFTHIIPFGFDHVLFILCVFFLNADIKKVILQATMFTLAHSITLGLAAYGIIDPPSNIIEPIIALSIVFLALENIFYDKVKAWRMVMVFMFGLVHGMGFAGALSDLGLPRYAFFKALISFNAGVEIGQLSIIVFMYFAVARMFASKHWYRQRIVIPTSVAIALVACYWTVERIIGS